MRPNVTTRSPVDEDREVRARRILVAGAAGAGKTTLAVRIAAATGVPHTEIDALYWRAGWTANESFVEEVEALVAGDAWVTEFQYREVLPMLADRADLLVWLRPPRPLVVARVVRRTVRRRLRRELLWGVNREQPLWHVLTDRDHIIRYSIRGFRVTEDRLRTAAAAHPELPVVLVRSRRDADRLLARLAAG
jgi:adenylate kinase family enzyme